MLMDTASDKITVTSSMPSTWIQALKIWNSEHDKDLWAIPKRDTEYSHDVRTIMEGLKVKHNGGAASEIMTAPVIPEPITLTKSQLREQIKKAREEVAMRQKQFNEIHRAAVRASKGQPYVTKGYGYENAQDRLSAAKHTLAMLLAQKTA